MASLNATQVISLLGLEPLGIEGGYYRRIYESRDTFDPSVLGGQRYQPCRRPLSSVIYYLMVPESFSALHWLSGDEVWNFLLGDPVEQLVLFPDGKGEIRVMGSPLDGSWSMVSVVQAGCWQGTRLKSSPGSCGFALCSTVMSPAYDAADFKLGDGSLVDKYPRFAQEIQRFLA